MQRNRAHDSSLPHGRHTLDIECKGVLPIGVGNRVGVGLTRSNIRHLCSILDSQLREQVSNVRPLCHGPGNINDFVLVENPTDKERLLLKHQR